MAPWSIVVDAAIYGVILSVVLFPLVLALAWMNPEIMLNDYPPDVRAKHGPMSERAKRQRLAVAPLFIAILLGIGVVSFRGLHAASGGNVPFRDAAIHLFIMLSVFNVLDWLALDWLIVVRACPRFIVLPGTEGLAGYKDYGFHFRGFVIGMGLTAAASVLLAGVVALLF
jgi:hypothetical protein